MDDLGFYHDPPTDIPDEINFGLMYHGITYADEAFSDETQGKMTARFWYPVMKKGVITFLRPEDCPVIKTLRDMDIKPFGAGTDNLFESGNFSGLKEFGEVY